MPDNYSISQEDMAKMIIDQGQEISSLSAVVGGLKDKVRGLCDDVKCIFKGHVPSWTAWVMTVMGIAIGVLGTLAFHH